jgi:hypothetical protein
MSSTRHSRHDAEHHNPFSDRPEKYVSSRLIPQGQALRVAAQALTDQTRLHERVLAGRKNVDAVAIVHVLITQR